WVRRCSTAFTAGQVCPLLGHRPQGRIGRSRLTPAPSWVLHGPDASRLPPPSSHVGECPIAALAEAPAPSGSGASCVFRARSSTSTPPPATAVAPPPAILVTSSTPNRERSHASPACEPEE